MKNIFNKILLLLFTLGCTPVWAQFNPSNPGEPSITYKVKTSVNPEGLGYSCGDGSFSTGSTIGLSTYSYNSNYIFVNWTLDGSIFSTSKDTAFTVGVKDVSFVANYKYSPISPDEPNSIFRRKVSVESDPAGVAEFYMEDEQKVEVGSDIFISTGWKAGYKFIGWYIGSEILSTNRSFYYTVPNSNVTITAKFQFSPDSPEEPAFTPTLGDVNGSGYATIADVVALIKHAKGETLETFDENVADVDGNGVIDLDDAIALINIILEKDN